MPERTDTPLGAQLPHDLRSLRSLPATPQTATAGTPVRRRGLGKYERSPLWLDRRDRYVAEHPGGCVICQDPRVHVHHLAYDNLGNEPDADLLALCREHHDGLHQFFEPHRADMTLRQASAIYVAERGGPNLPPGEPLTPPRNKDRWAQIVAVACPTCGAEPGEPCWYTQRGRRRIITAGGGHGARKAAAQSPTNQQERTAP